MSSYRSYRDGDVRGREEYLKNARQHILPAEASPSTVARGVVLLFYNSPPHAIKTFEGCRKKKKGRQEGGISSNSNIVHFFMEV